jgi:hypothetical protein
MHICSIVTLCSECVKFEILVEGIPSLNKCIPKTRCVLVGAPLIILRVMNP